MTEKITFNQENRLTDLFRDSVRALDLSKDEAQQIIESGGTLQKEVAPILKKLADKRFGPAISEFELSVPSDFNHHKQIDVFSEAEKQHMINYYNCENFTSKNFANVTNKLEAGKKYKVKIFPIIGIVKAEECLDFLKEQKAILVGGQGLTLVYSVCKDRFPMNKYVVSFDEKASLFEDSDGRHLLPYVIRYPDGLWALNLGDFESPWNSSFCLFCFCG